MRHATILVAILAFTPLTSATAQVRPGARVRVTGHFCQPFYSNCVGGSPQQYVGTLVNWDADTLVMESGNIFALPLESVTTLEVSAGRRSQTGLGAGIGALIGAVIGAVGGAAGCTGGGFVSPGGCAFAGGLVFGIGGALLGAVVGTATKTDRWVAVPLDRLRVSVGPQRDGRFGLGLSVRF